MCMIFSKYVVAKFLFDQFNRKASKGVNNLVIKIFKVTDIYR